MVSLVCNSVAHIFKVYSCHHPLTHSRLILSKTRILNQSTSLAVWRGDHWHMNPGYLKVFHQTGPVFLTSFYIIRITFKILLHFRRPRVKMKKFLIKFMVDNILAIQFAIAFGALPSILEWKCWDCGTK